MKTTIVYLALALIISATSIQAQEIKDGFKIEKTEIGGKPAICYSVPRSRTSAEYCSACCR